MNTAKLYNLLLDGKARSNNKVNLTEKFKRTCEEMPYLPQCKTYDA
jgi:hypothetical protein